MEYTLRGYLGANEELTLETRTEESCVGDAKKKKGKIKEENDEGHFELITRWQLCGSSEDSNDDESILDSDSVFM